MNLVVMTSLKINTKMRRMIYPLARACEKIIEVCFNDVFDVMEGIQHSSLEGGLIIFNIERHLVVRKSSPRT